MMIRDFSKSTLFENPLKQSPKVRDGLHQDLTLRHLFDRPGKKAETQPTAGNGLDEKVILDLRPVERNQPKMTVQM